MLDRHLQVWQASLELCDCQYGACFFMFQYCISSTGVTMQCLFAFVDKIRHQQTQQQGSC